MSLKDETPFLFTRMTEDCVAELTVMNLMSVNRPLSVFCISSCGESAVVYACLPDSIVGSVVACDMNPFQLYFAQLLRAAFATLESYEQVWDLVGIPKDYDAERARDLLQTVLEKGRKECFSKDAFDFWNADSRIDTFLKKRLCACGKNEETFVDLRRDFAASKPRVDLMANPGAILANPEIENVVLNAFSIDRNAWKFFKGSQMTEMQKARAIENLKGWFKPEKYIANWRQWFVKTTADVSVDIAAVLGSLFSGTRSGAICVDKRTGSQPEEVARNPYWTLNFADPSQYDPSSDVEQLPVVYTPQFWTWLPPTKCDTLLTKLSFVVGAAEKAIQGEADEDGLPKKLYDFVSLSNIMDWMTPQQITETLEKVAASVAPGGVIMVRKFFEGSSGILFSESVWQTGCLVLHEEWTRAARMAERSSFWEGLYVLCKK
eukprot:ANDGO_05162.mRNA.1 hypothetical protein